jgi:hypothetical protein
LPQKKVKAKVWIVMHYEYMGDPVAPFPDALQFHVSSTLKRAESYIRGRGVESHSWWQIHPHVLDAKGDDAEGEEVHYYSYRGTKLKAAPHARTRAAFDRHVLRYPGLHWPIARPESAPETLEEKTKSPT